MKKIILIATSILLFSFLTLFTGCGGNQEQPKQAEEKPINVLDPDFKGPDSLPFSHGPSAPPPAN